MRWLLVVFTICHPMLNASGQDSLFSNPNITWIGEVYADYRMAPLEYIRNNKFTELQSWNSLKLLGLQQDVGDSGFESGEEHPVHIWQEIVFGFMNKEGANTYRDPNLEHTLSYEEWKNKLYRVDTAINCFAIDTMSQLLIVHSQIDLTDIVGIRARHLLYYDTLLDIINVQVVSYGPLIPRYDELGELQGLEPIFWLPAIEKEEKHNSKSAA